MIYILLPVHNRKDVTIRFVSCLKNQLYQSYHLVLIDDGSSDGTGEDVKKQLQEKVTVIRGNGNLWWAGSLQKGLEWLKIKDINNDDLVLIINDDVEFDQFFLSNGINVLSEKQNTLLLARFWDGNSKSVKETGIFADLNKINFSIAETPDKINCLSTRGLLGYWKEIKSIGGLKPKILPHYLSDYEFTIRAYKKGIKLATDERFFLIPHPDTSGLHSLNSDQGIKEFFKVFFSKKFSSNPIYITSFVFLTRGITISSFYIVFKIWLYKIKKFI